MSLRATNQTNKQTSGYIYVYIFIWSQDIHFEIFWDKVILREDLFELLLVGVPDLDLAWL